jgi:poly(A) polymerase
MPSDKKAVAYSIIRHLIDKGHEAYLVGGCVRDKVMGIEPPDYDIATSARPEVLQQIFRRTVPVGAHFGVILVVEEGQEFEVATFRADDCYVDGRRPTSVRFVSAEEDVKRRDFTINGLLLDILTDKVIDFVGGLDDIKAGILRTIGDPEARFQEDKLRLMRAVRFAARFSFTLEEKTLAALRRYAGSITEVSQERIRDELLKMLMQAHPEKALLLLYSTGLLERVLPEVEALIGVQQPEVFHPEGDVFEHTLKVLECMDKDMEVAKTETLALSALFHDIGKPQTFYQAKDRIRFNNHPTVGGGITENILRRLRFPNHIVEDVTFCVEDHMNFMNAKKMRQNTLKRFIRNPAFPTELDLHRLDCLASHGDLEIYHFLVEKRKALGAEKISPPPLITGKRLIEMGYSPGPVFKKILTEVEDLQLEDKISTIGEAEEYVQRNYLIKQ